MEKRPTAKRIKQLTNYLGDVWVYELSKTIVRGKKHLVISNSKPRTGDLNITIWYSDATGKILDNKPVKKLKAKTVAAALNVIGYDLV